MLKGNEAIKAILEKVGEKTIAFSIITHAEAYAGSSKEEVKSLKLLFANYPVFHIEENASKIFNGLI